MDTIELVLGRCLVETIQYLIDYSNNFGTN